MIKQQIADSLALVVGKVLQSGIVLNPMPETPMHRISTASTGVVYQGVLAENDQPAMRTMQLIASVTEAATVYNPQLLTESPHDSLMREMTELATTGILNALQIAKNVVNPMVVSVYEHVRADVDSEDSYAGLGISVEPIVFDTVWSNDVIHDLVNRHAEVGSKNVRLPAVHPALTDDQLHELMMTGGQSLDNEITQFISSVGISMVRRVYEDVFYTNIHNRERDVRNYFTLGVQGSRALMIAFLLGCGLSNNLQEKIDVNGLDNYREWIGDFVQQVGLMLTITISDITKVFRDNRMVVAYPNRGSVAALASATDNTVLVIGDLYTKWLEDGGMPEILFGAALSDRETDIVTLMENRDRYMSVWTRQLGLLRSMRVSNQLGVARRSLQREIAEAIVNTSDDNLTGSKSDKHKMLETMLDKFNMGDLENLYSTVREMVCVILFPHTDSLKLLMAIDTIAKQNPGIGVREAALLAAIDAVVAWVMSQVIVTKAM